MPYLEVRTPKGKRRLELQDEGVSVGRLPENMVQLNDSGLSRKHCIVEPVGNGRWQIRDLGSRNGTKLNKVRIDAEKLLENGDLVRVGSVELRFIDPERAGKENTGERRKGRPDTAARDRFAEREQRAKSASQQATLGTSYQQERR